MTLIPLRAVRMPQFANIFALVLVINLVPPFSDIAWVAKGEALLSKETKERRIREAAEFFQKNKFGSQSPNSREKIPGGH